MTVSATYRVEAKLSDTVDQFFDEEIADFDSVTPAWDKEVDEVGDFDAEVDADGDLNDSTDAAHDGDNGLEITIDDANPAYGTMNADAVNQTSGVVTLWFDKNDMAINAGGFFWLFYANNGVGLNNWQSIIYNNGGTFQVNLRWRDDVTAQFGSAYVNIPAGYNKFTYMWQRSTGAGNDDGWMRLYINDILVLSATGIDNDTTDWDYVHIGVIAPTAFGGESGSLYMDTIKIDPIGAPMVDTLAVQNGTYGLAIPVMDTTGRYGSFTNPIDEKVAMAECWIDQNTLTMADADAFVFLYSFDVTAGGAPARVYLKKDGANYKIYARIRNDAGVNTSTASYTITDAPHFIRIYWAASTGDGDDNGYLYLYIDHVLQEAITGHDNDTLRIDTVSFGAHSALDAGTYGVFYLDDCKWGSWIDISSDVIGDIQGYWGIIDNDPLDLLADTGVMGFILNNESGNYLPGMTGALDGFKKGTPVRLRFSYSDLDYVRFYGTIDALDPAPGAFEVNKVVVEVTDWMDYAATHPIVNPSIGTDQRADEMLTTIVADMPIAPKATDYDEGINTFPTAFDNVTTKTKAYTEINKTLLSELGYGYLIKDAVYGETLVFENAEARNGLRAPDFTADNTMFSLDVEYGKNVINRFINKVYPRSVDAAPVVLFDIEVRQRIPSGQTIEFRGNYVDPDGGGTEVSGINMLDPVINVDYTATGNKDGTGANYTANQTVVVDKGTEGTTFTITNGAVSTAWIWIRIRGDGVYAYNPIENSAEDAPSVAAYDYITTILNQKYMDDLGPGALAGAAIIEQEKQPRTKLNKVNFVANRTDSLMTGWLTGDSGMMVHITEDDMGIDEYAYIQGVAFTISLGGLVKYSWFVKGMLSLLLGLSLISCETDALSTDGVNYGYLPQISDHAALNRSYSAWVYIHSISPITNEHIMGPFSDAAGCRVGTAVNNAIQFYQKGAVGPGWWETPNNSIVLNTWTHVLVTRDASVAANVPIIYIGGVDQAPLAEPSAQNGATAPETGANFFIGNVDTTTVNWGYPFDGVIKDVRVYNVILTQAEATSLAAGGNVTRGMVFQSPCVRTSELADFEDLTLTTEKLIDNMFGCVGTPNNSVITRLIP